MDIKTIDLLGHAFAECFTLDQNFRINREMRNDALFQLPTFVREELLLLKLKELVYILSDSGNNLIVSQLLGILYTKEEIEFDEIIHANRYNNLSIAVIVLIIDK